MAIQEAVANAQRQYFGMPGIVGISYSENTIIFYVETAEDAQRIPSSYMGYPCRAVVSGRFRVL